jgi:hypothetical protein
VLRPLRIGQFGATETQVPRDLFGVCAGPQQRGLAGTARAEDTDERACAGEFDQLRGELLAAEEPVVSSSWNACSPT